MDPLLEIITLRARIAELERALDDKPREMPDGSTRRHVRRPRCQSILRAIWDAFDEQDELAALEAFGELENDAEADYVNGVLDSAQRRWLGACKHTSQVQGGWG